MKLTRLTREWTEASNLMRWAYVLEWIAFVAFVVMLLALGGWI